MKRKNGLKRYAVVMAAAAVTAVWISGCALDDTETSEPSLSVETVTDSTDDTAATSDTDTAYESDTEETVTDTASDTDETGTDTAQAGNADAEIKNDTVWITVDDTYAADAGSWTKDDFQNAERFTVKADGTWSCEAPEGDMFGGQSGTWSKSDGNTILMDNPEGGTGNKGCSIEFTDTDKGEAELLTQYGKCKMIRTDTECGNIASQLFDQVLGGSQ
jgi:hypothetical protein